MGESEYTNNFYHLITSTFDYDFIVVLRGTWQVLGSSSFELTRVPRQSSREPTPESFNFSPVPESQCVCIYKAELAMWHRLGGEQGLSASRVGDSDKRILDESVYLVLVHSIWGSPSSSACSLVTILGSSYMSSSSRIIASCVRL